MNAKLSTRLLTFLLAASGVAQEANQGTITGFVYDQSEGVVSEAEIAATSQATRQVRVIKSGSDGVYTIAALQPGLYTVRVTAPGF